MLKGLIYHKDIIIVNMYASSWGAPKYAKHTLMEIMGEIDSNTVIVVYCNTLLTSANKAPRQKIIKEMVALNDTLG